MRNSCVEDCKNIFAKFGITFTGKEAIEVGGNDIVSLDDVISQNPLIALCPGIVLLDKGFNVDTMGASTNLQVDFLDYDSIAPLENKFDLVFTFDTLEHIPNPFLFCENLVNVTKPGGYIYLSTVFSYGYHPSPEDYYRFSPKGLSEVFSNQYNKNFDKCIELHSGWGSDPRGVEILCQKKK